MSEEQKKSKHKEIGSMIQALLMGVTILFFPKDAIYTKIIGWWQLGVGIIMLVIVLIAGVMYLIDQE